MAKVTVRTGKSATVPPSKGQLEVDNDEAVFQEREFNGPADELIEACRQWLERTEHQEATPDRIKELSNKILNRRLET